MNYVRYAVGLFMYENVNSRAQGTPVAAMVGGRENVNYHLQSEVFAKNKTASGFILVIAPLVLRVNISIYVLNHSEKVLAFMLMACRETISFLKRTPHSVLR